jgi:transposase
MEQRPDGETSMLQDPEAYPCGLITEDGVPAFSEADWQLTPKAVRLFVLRLVALGVGLEKLREEVERLRAMIRSDSSNSNKPPSSDSPYKLHWLWVMANATVAFFLVHPHRSKEAFLELIHDWVGILVSGGYGLYRQWVELRQSCLAHLIRKDKGLAESADPEIARFGRKMAGELGRLCHMAHAPPTVGYRRAWYARFTHLVSQHQGRKDAAGSLARRLLGEMESLWVFIEVEGVEPTNNRAERALRYGVLWRKRSQGTQSDRGNRWVERILSLRQTCRLRGTPTYPVLVEATEAYFKGHSPDLAWIAQH